MEKRPQGAVFLGMHDRLGPPVGPSGRQLPVAAGWLSKVTTRSCPEQTQ
jgi:hypothetical protein